jgi:hypothetical protein
MCTMLSTCSSAPVNNTSIHAGGRSSRDAAVRPRHHSRSGRLRAHERRQRSTPPPPPRPSEENQWLPPPAPRPAPRDSANAEPAQLLTEILPRLPHLQPPWLQASKQRATSRVVQRRESTPDYLELTYLHSPASPPIPTPSDSAAGGEREVWQARSGGELDWVLFTGERNWISEWYTTRKTLIHGPIICGALSFGAPRISIRGARHIGAPHVMRHA